MGEHSNEEYVPKIKKTIGKNETRSKNLMYFRRGSRGDIEREAKELGIKFIKQTGVESLVEKIENFHIEEKPKTLVELREVAKTMGVEHINSYSKNDLIKKLSEMRLSETKRSNLESKTVVELRQIAKERGIKRINSYSKKDLLEKLE